MGPLIPALACRSLFWEPLKRNFSSQDGFILLPPSLYENWASRQPSQGRRAMSSGTRGTLCSLTSQFTH